MISDVQLSLECMPAFMGNEQRKLATTYEATPPRQVTVNGQEYTLIGSCSADGRRVAVLLTEKDRAIDVMILNRAQSEDVFNQPARDGDACLVQKWELKKWFTNPNYPAEWQQTYAHIKPFTQDAAAQQCKVAANSGKLQFFFNDPGRIQAYCGAVTVQQADGQAMTWSVSMQQGKEKFDVFPQNMMAWTYCQVRARLSACANDPDTQGRLEFLRVNAGNISPASCPALLAR